MASKRTDEASHNGTRSSSVTNSSCNGTRSSSVTNSSCNGANDFSDKDSAEQDSDDGLIYAKDIPAAGTGNYIPYRRGKMADWKDDEEELARYRAVAMQEKFAVDCAHPGVYRRVGNGDGVAGIPVLDHIFESCDAIALRAMEDNL
ncbi:hypothetical protein BV898_17368 [Hypsibius exemplaris]|uniref:Uncharacterized protein n=1 Tax=Hypsibius exemplaris TaxID=2072580 RepID=A0A9X6RMQ7_HYPEX|nr:hypothetical protein BV898_17368 [Hypsibius exemplaris]